MPIVWTDKARGQIPHRRREDAPPFTKGHPKQIWETVRRSFAVRGKYDPIEGTFVLGRAQTTPALAELMARCEPLARSDEPPALDDLDVAAVMSLLVSKNAYGRGLPLLLATLPVPRAFAAHLRSRDFSVTPSYANVNNPYRLLAADADADVVDPEWRDILLAQPDEIRAECKDIARTVMASGAHLGKRTTLAYAFFEETEWGNAVSRDWVGRGLRRGAPLNDIVHDFELVEAIVKDKNHGWNYAPLVDRFGERMLPLLVAMAEKPFDRWHARDVAETLSLFDDPEAAAAMTRLLQLASSRPHALEYFQRWPKHAEGALEAVASLKGRAAKIARDVLTGVQRSVANAVKPEDEAPVEDLPRVLASPPWLDEKKPRKPSTKLALEPIAPEEVVDWPQGARESAQKHFNRPQKEMSPEALADYQKAIAEGKYVSFLVVKGESVPDDVVLATWNEGKKTYGGSLAQKLEFVLATFGDRAFPGLPAFVDALASGWGDAPLLLHVRSWRLALPMAKNVAQRKVGKTAWQWLQRHAELAVLSLVPVAFGEDKTAREHAERALFRLRASGVDVVSIGARYGAPAKAALEKLFAWDPLYDLPKKLPQLGTTWRADTLTRPRLRATGKALPLAALDTIATMLAFSPIDPPYPGLLQVTDTCEPRSLAEFSWEMARAWEYAGHKKKEDWMLMSLVHFADDEVVRRLTPGVRADFAVRVLEAIGTDAALMEMATIAGRTSSQGGEWTLAGRIEKLLGEAADERGVSKDELEEDLAPTAELDEHGSLVLDYGARTIEVGFDERLVPYVKNESGTRGRALPPARKSDDVAKIERAKVTWRDLKEDVTVLAARRIRALDRAMTTGRTWTFERFRRVWVEHRLMRHIARGVVWTDGATAFRVAEDGTLSNADDSPHDLPEKATIGVAHPLRMSKEELDKWRTLFDDYAIAQPFAQLGRQYVTVDAGATRLPWPFGPIPANDLTTRLVMHGFSRGAWEQGKQSYHRDLAAGRLRVEFKFNRGTMDAEAALILQREGKEIPASEFDPIELADAIYDLQA